MCCRRRKSAHRCCYRVLVPSWGLWSIVLTTAADCCMRRRGRRRGRPFSRSLDRAFTPGAEEAPGTYQLEASADELYVRWHYVAEDETRSFRLRYRISEAVTSHPDVAEFYFQFVGEINPQMIGSVEVDLALPDAAVFDEVRAWAHGPLHGRVDHQDSGRLSFTVSPLPARQRWEARVTFPWRWCAETSVRRGPGHRDGRRGMIST